MGRIAAVAPVVCNVSPKTNWTFVKVTTDDGAVGVGECSLNGWEPLLTSYCAMLAPRLAGCDVDAAVARLAYVPHSPGGLVVHAVKSAVEQALAGLRAAAQGRSVSAMLSTSPRAAVPAYANINRGVKERSPAGFGDAARRAVAAGYRAVKLAPFDGVIAQDAGHTPIDERIRAGLDRIFAVRDAVGAAVDVMVDCHWRFDEARATALLRDLENARLFWIECMTTEHPEGFPAIARLTALAHERGMRTAGGEMITGADGARAMCKAGLYDVLMPDIKYAGGFAGMHAIAQVCEAHGVAFAPHNPTGPVAHVASIHACAVEPATLILEHQWNESPLFGTLVGDALPALTDGAFAVPAGPGLGVEPDPAVVAAHPYRALPADANLDERLG
ncbi:MAG: mandelate racemase/muconate lactonizing enzyme family protein [Burkholderiales bacterium]